MGTDVGRGLDYALSLGVEDVVDVRTDRFDRMAEPVDLVIDTVGGDALSSSLPLLRPGGTLISSVRKQLTVRIGSVLPLPEARRAREMLEGTVPRPAGKIVLAIDAATATT